jgi:hypothetical protein
MTMAILDVRDLPRTLHKGFCRCNPPQKVYSRAGCYGCWTCAICKAFGGCDNRYWIESPDQFFATSSLTHYVLEVPEPEYQI